jgi:hypothetical protein
MTDQLSVHMMPAAWTARPDGLDGVIQSGQTLLISVSATTAGTELQVSLRVKNLLATEIGDVRADICSAVSHLPGSPDWLNPRFLPGVPLDRGVAGRVWFEKITPKGLFALTGAGWTPAHPRPDSPDAASVPLYSFLRSPKVEAVACAARSPDGRRWFYQGWNVLSRWCTPCPGNSCMHLDPVLAKKLAPGAEAEARGVVGMFDGDRDALTEMLTKKLTRFARS